MEQNATDMIPMEFSQWVKEVKSNDLRVERAMIAVVSLAYKLNDSRDPPADSRDLQAKRIWKAKRRKMHRSMRHALHALSGALKQEYGPEVNTRPVRWTGATEAVSAGVLPEKVDERSAKEF